MILDANWGTFKKIQGSYSYIGAAEIFGYLNKNCDLKSKKIYAFTGSSQISNKGSSFPIMRAVRLALYENNVHVQTGWDKNSTNTLKSFQPLPNRFGWSPYCRHNKDSYLEIFCPWTEFHGGWGYPFSATTYSSKSKIWAKFKLNILMSINLWHLNGQLIFMIFLSIERPISYLNSSSCVNTRQDCMDFAGQVVSSFNLQKYAP